MNLPFFKISAVDWMLPQEEVLFFFLNAGNVEPEA